MLELNIADYHHSLLDHQMTTEALVAFYLERIKQFDGFLSSIISINPAAITLARECDRILHQTGKLSGSLRSSITPTSIPMTRTRKRNSRKRMKPMKSFPMPRNVPITTSTAMRASTLQLTAVSAAELITLIWMISFRHFSATSEGSADLAVSAARRRDAERVRRAARTYAIA